MSWVFLAGRVVFKLKKPVRYDFLNFSSVEKRRIAVMDEVRLNRRLAPDVYLSGRALRVAADGRLTLTEMDKVIGYTAVPITPKSKEVDKGAVGDASAIESRETSWPGREPSPTDRRLSDTLKP